MKIAAEFGMSEILVRHSAIFANDLYEMPHRKKAERGLKQSGITAGVV